MRKKTSTIMAWLLAASVIVTSLSAGTVTAYAQEEMPLAEAGTVTESAEEFGDSSDGIADIVGEGNIEAKEKGELTALCCVVSPFLCVMKFLNCKAVGCVRNPSGKIRI